jgi:hypothetical protein
MSDSVLEEYIGRLADPLGEPLVRELNRIIRRTQPDLDAAIKYKILMYGLNRDFHTWVCAINSGRRRVSLNFLYGVMLEDARHVLRSGSSVLMSWDFPFDEEIEQAAVAAYVADAAAKNEDYKENRQAVQDAAYAAAEQAGRRPGSARS